MLTSPRCCGRVGSRASASSHLVHGPRQTQPRRFSTAVRSTQGSGAAAPHSAPAEQGAAGGYIVPSPDVPISESLTNAQPGAIVKAALLDAICGTERGLVARSEVRAEINELVNQLEVQGGQGADVASLEFEGTWELLYTNAVELLAILAINKLPLSPVKIGAVTQTINSTDRTVENSLELQLPLIITSLSTVSNYNVASPKRLQFTVERGVLHTPSIEGNLELPASITVMGQTLDLAPLRDAVKPLQDATKGLAASASDLLGQAPDLELPLQSLGQANTQGWQLTTYLDPELRVTRGDGGAVYIFKKAGPKPLE
ncbi:hypothetical protein CHLRE_03g189300v5 [Chlamydomonas reinhardtii]|uniref:Plastid lipid-associated protein/fibrillin conserved domain-containing protein n=1 Tax=Chlamydomonas reinhardtii TaxID=3055 RepID=A8IRT4_CHLRE|nr:uncharacterized protein CHLRE_03g189300v5 [Chlamydomonas reinhardtii]PNW85497.1 hypothetical protein CHLRE_03g189300v5 [Chlamydomonas reinhardtii]|eukprot:XP_001692028.1 plastid lipid associated protein [Chlamydomonas reinhardtii]